jgi:hypothetical protein
LGARFDMEIDALFMRVLPALVWPAGQAGGLVLTAGPMRYIFLGVGWVWPALVAPLPASFRRRAICGAVILMLPIALERVLRPEAAGRLCLAGLVLLGYSFTADTLSLVGRALHRAPGVTR